MILHFNWIHALAGALQDPFLTPERLQALRYHGMIFSVREDTEYHGILILQPLSEKIALLFGVWISEGEDEMAISQQLLAPAIARIKKEDGAMILIPDCFMRYVTGRAMTPAEAGVDVQGVRSLMGDAQIPNDHPLKHMGFKVVCTATPTSASHEF